MRSSFKNIQLTLEFLKTPFLVLHISYYTLMAFLMMLCVTLLSLSMILFFTLGVIKFPICGNNLDALHDLLPFVQF